MLLLLVAANLAFYLFTQGWLDDMFGVRALGDREPERLARQVRPESIRVLPAAPAASEPAVAAGTCYEAGPFAAGEAAAVEATLRSALPAGAWTDVRAESVTAGGLAVSHLYRVAAADAALASRLAGLRLDPSGRGFVACGGRIDRPR